jgi:hypothetical protein
MDSLDCDALVHSSEAKLTDHRGFRTFSLVSRCNALLTMENLFAPTTRFRDLHRAARERGDDVRVTEEEVDGLVELELITGYSAEDTFLRRGFMWSDFHSWAGGKMVWISPDVCFDLSPLNPYFQTEYRTFLTVDIILSNDEDDTSQESEYLRVLARSGHTQLLRVTFYSSS